MKNVILNLLIWTSICAPLTLKAQKLPGEQTSSVNLPAGFKIDGLANEWNDKFLAHNKNTETNYTVANNNQYVYLAVQATDPLSIKKIIGGGITFTINTSGQKADRSPYSITFPVVPNSSQIFVFNSIVDMGLYINQKKAEDSVINIVNNKITSAAKEIKVKGFKTITDTLIAVYNETGIKSAAQINKDGALTCEFLVPIKLLGITPNSGKMIFYNVMVNGVTSIQQKNYTSGVTVRSVPNSLSANSSNLSILQYPTDFWGSYTLK
ncbi:MAG TPA: hypothetical protein VL490_04545 [Mucilaginibacter sp.]|jgi:hypothetical protein|nr:hypothetical protein [Mucilaginibacter sp.]